MLQDNTSLMYQDLGLSPLFTAKDIEFPYMDNWS